MIVAWHSLVLILKQQQDTTREAETWFNDFLIIGNVREGYLRYFIFLFHKTKTF